MTLQMWTQWLLVGLVLGTVFVAVARLLGERLIFSVGLVFLAILYVGVAWFNGADWRWVGIEALGIPIYGLFALLGARSPGWLALGWAVHPIWDVALHLVGGGVSVVPLWYPIQCISFDLVVALYIALRWRRAESNRPIKSERLQSSSYSAG